MGYFLIILVLFCSSSFADQVVFYDKNTKEVKFIVDDANKVVLSAEDAANTETKVIKGKLELDNKISDYKVSGNNIVLNTQKISAENKAVEDAEKDRLNKVQKRKSAEDKLKALGLDEQEIDALTGRE